MTMLPNAQLSAANSTSARPSGVVLASVCAMINTRPERRDGQRYELEGTHALAVLIGGQRHGEEDLCLHDKRGEGGRDLPVHGNEQDAELTDTDKQPIGGEIAPWHGRTLMKSTAGSSAAVNRNAANISGGRCCRPIWMTTKFVPHTAMTATASSA